LIVRPKVKEENEGMSFGDIARKLGEMWKALDAEDKGEYELQAAEVRLNAFALFLSSHSFFPPSFTSFLLCCPSLATAPSLILRCICHPNDPPYPTNPTQDKVRYEKEMESYVHLTASQSIATASYSAATAKHSAATASHSIPLQVRASGG
jgi:hypothetical protein